MSHDTLHLDHDDLDALLDGRLEVLKLRHLDLCDPCREFVRAEKELAARLSALPLLTPGAGFADRIITAVLPDRAPVPARAGFRQRFFGSRRSLAIAASVTVAVLGSMGASIGWSLSHQETLASAGTWLTSQASQWLWVGLRAAASNLFEQPWYDRARSLIGSPERLALGSASLTLAYITGVLMLRRLLTAPTSGVARVHA